MGSVLVWMALIGKETVSPVALMKMEPLEPIRVAQCVKGVVWKRLMAV